MQWRVNSECKASTVINYIHAVMLCYVAIIICKFVSINQRPTSKFLFLILRVISIRAGGNCSEFGANQIIEGFTGEEIVSYSFR